MHRARVLLVGWLFAFLLCMSSAHAEGPFVEGPFVGVDVGGSEPTNPNYRGHVQAGATLNPYGGYMFNPYLGVQGQIQVTIQQPDVHIERDVKNPTQTTTVLGFTAGPRLSLPLWDLIELYGTVQGGEYVGVSGRMSHAAPGFTVGPGINIKVTDGLAVGLWARWTRAYMSPSPKDLGPDQVPSQRFGEDARWASAGVSVMYRFPHAERAAAPLVPIAEAPAPEIRRVIVPRVLFDFDKSTILPDAVPILDEAVQLLNETGDKVVIAEGHTDSIGTVTYNLKLSRRRAQAVRKYLTDHGISPKRIQIEGLGESRPIASNATVEGRAQNRRVELRIQ